MKARRVDGEVFHIAELLLPLENCDLILLEQRPPLILKAIFGTVDPLFDDGFRDGYRGCGSLLRECWRWNCDKFAEREERDECAYRSKSGGELHQAFS